MRTTLFESLEELSELASLGSRCSIKVPMDKIVEAREGVLKEFYLQNSLAYAVSQGDASYSDEIKFIEGKYDSFWKKVSCPEKDEEFDKRVERVVGSMNDVGNDWYLIDRLTTEGRINHLSIRVTLARMLGGCPLPQLPSFKNLDSSAKRTDDFLQNYASAPIGELFAYINPNEEE